MSCARGIAVLLLGFATAPSTVVGQSIMGDGFEGPWQVWPTSYENKHNARIDNPRLPFLHDVASITLEPEEMYFWSRSVAFADFFRDGTWGAMAFSTFWRDRFPGYNPNHMPDSPSKLYFLHRLPDGRWEDRTLSLLGEGQSRFTCLQPNYLQVADFNNDGSPDVFLTCTGVDFLTADPEVDGLSDQFVVLSQPDGRYAVNRLDMPPIYSHGAAVADIDGDGNQDILPVAPGVPTAYAMPIMLWGRGDGTFELDATRFPAEMKSMPIFTIFAIPIDGRIKVVVSGNAPGEAPTHPEWRYGTKVFTYVDGSFQLELDLTPTLPKVADTDLTFGLALDVVHHGGYYYLWLVGLDYLNYGIAEMQSTTGEAILIRQQPSDPNNWESGSMKLMASGDVLSQMAGCGTGTEVPGAYNHNACIWSFSVR